MFQNGDGMEGENHMWRAKEEKIEVNGKQVMEDGGWDGGMEGQVYWA
jgi:hypothetical protein